MNLTHNAELMKSQTIGVEIEMGKISKIETARIIGNYFNEKYGVDIEIWNAGAHNAVNVYGKPDANGNPRVWKCMDDGSSSGDWGHISCEMVTPILTYDDIPDLQEIVRRLRGAGARSGAHWNSGVHIHIGADFDRDGGLTAKSTRNLVNLIASHERLICDAVNVSPNRANWCRFVDPHFLREINRKKPTTKRALEILWYGHTGTVHDHYDPTRYHLLNLHAIWDKGTVEFRCFEFHNNLHAGELKSWIQMCLAMMSYAKLVNRCSPRPVETDNPKYAMKTWLINMGLSGAEFKTCRKMLTKNLAGDTAYKIPRAHVADVDDDDVVTTDSAMWEEGM